MVGSGRRSGGRGGSGSRGARRRPPALPAVILTLLMAAHAHAEQTGEYGLEILPDGTPRFTQVLKWDADPNVLYYELTLQTADGQDITETRLEVPTLSLHLGPGRYRYRIAAYNLLRQREVELPWCSFTVLKAEIPQITAVSPEVWFLEDMPDTLTIMGESLVPGASIHIRPETPGAAPITVLERERQGAEVVRVSYPQGAIVEGWYTVETTNPGGLSATFRGAFLARHMLPAPTGLVPPKGTTFGPGELRGMASIVFTWEPVPEANLYDFRLYRGHDAEPLARLDTLEGLSYTLTDLTLLDRGDYRWTVEAAAREGEVVVIPAAALAESAFRIDFPYLASPSLDTGDVYYGR